MTDFKVGDIVKLKSGGPAMTISKISTGPDNKISLECIWFIGINKNSDIFPNEVVEKASKKGVGSGPTTYMAR